MALETDYVTIQQPGLQDIIRIPILESEQLKKERIQRYRASKSPVPDFLRFIPEWINHLDDAQDLIFVALALGKLLAPKVLAANIPLVGWALLANDVLNLATTILGAAQLTKFPKRAILEGAKTIRQGRAGRVSAGAAFVKGPFPWLPFAIQAPQVLYNFTGYGLQLGTIMGAASDAIWAGFRSLTGKKVKVIAPPPSDPLGRAARVTTQSWMLPYAAPHATWDDLKISILGQAAASAILADYVTAPRDHERQEAFGDFDYPGFAPWDPTTRAALQSEGYSDNDLMLRPRFIDERAPTMKAATRRSIAHDPNLDRTIAEKAPPTGESRAVQQIYEEAANHRLDAYFEAPESIAPQNTPWERLLSRMWHENVFPPWEIEPCTQDINKMFPITALPTDTDPGRRRVCRQYYFATRSLSPGGGEGPIIVSPNWRLPRFLPTPYEDKAHQLLWFLQIALAVRCGKDLQLPFFGATPYAGLVIVSNKHRAGLMAQKFPLRVASLLVWGQAWAHDLSDTDIEPKPKEPIPFCIYDKRSPYPKLAGIRQDTALLYTLRKLLPEPGTLPQEIEADFRELGGVLWQGNDAPDPTVPLPSPPR